MNMKLLCVRIGETADKLTIELHNQQISTDYQSQNHVETAIIFR